MEERQQRGVFRQMFQCSSASRKFLNLVRSILQNTRFVSFSALQRAENSSMTDGDCEATVIRAVSVLFSEPKIPQSRPTIDFRTDSTRFSALQRAENSSICPAPQPQRLPVAVSVLFSEPKIPQSG